MYFIKFYSVPIDCGRDNSDIIVIFAYLIMIGLFLF